MWAVRDTMKSRKLFTFLYYAKNQVTFFTVFVFSNLLACYAWGKSQWCRNPGDWPEIQYQTFPKKQHYRILGRSPRLRQRGIQFFLLNLRLHRVLTYLLYFFIQKMQRHVLSRKPFIVVTDLLTHAWDGSTYVRVLACIPILGKISQGDGCLSSLSTWQNRLFLILVLLRSVFLCWWHHIIGAQQNTVECTSWLTLIQWYKFSIWNISILSGYIDLNDSLFGFWDWW